MKIAFFLLLFHFKTKFTSKYLLPRLAHNYTKSEYDELQSTGCEESNNQVIDTDGQYQKHVLKREERHFRKERLYY